MDEETLKYIFDEKQKKEKKPKIKWCRCAKCTKKTAIILWTGIWDFHISADKGKEQWRQLQFR